VRGEFGQVRSGQVRSLLKPDWSDVSVARFSRIRAVRQAAFTVSQVFARLTACHDAAVLQLQRAVAARCS